MHHTGKTEEDKTMTTITLKVPDELAAHLPVSEAEREQYLLEALKEKLEAGGARPPSLRPLEDYASEAEYLREAARLAPRHGVDPETAAAIAEGIADAAAGRTLTLEEAHEVWRAQRAKRVEREAA
jgi:predicted transcriptional regulator